MITLGYLKSHLQITSNAFDGLLNDYIAWATKQIEDYCEQPVAVTLRTIPVKSYEILPVNVLSIASVQGRNSIQQAWQTLSLLDYTLVTQDLTRQYLEIRSNFWQYQASLLVGISPVPAPIVRVCYEICKEAAQNDGILGGEETFRVSQIAKSKGGDTQTTVLANLSNAHKALLAPYKIVRLS
jgi:hypothetical protein